MKRVSIWVLVGVLACGSPLFAQKRGQGGNAGGGKAAPASGGSAGGRSASAPSGSSGGSSRAAGAARSASSGDSSKTSSGDTARARSAPAAAASDGSSGKSDTAAIRSRDGQPIRGEAVARRGNQGGGTTVVVGNGGYWGGYYPWGWGGLGFGGYYGGFYDPFWYGGGPYYGGGYYGGGYYNDDGALRLKMKPRDASVYVDGYFAGQVDDYDGVFQKLRMESGPHRIEVRADGYEPLMFEIRIQPDRTITYSGELKEAPPEGQTDEQ